VTPTWTLRQNASSHSVLRVDADRNRPLAAGRVPTGPVWCGLPLPQHPLDSLTGARPHLYSLRFGARHTAAAARARAGVRVRLGSGH
jgi:hypothetical protein